MGLQWNETVEKWTPVKMKMRFFPSTQFSQKFRPGERRRLVKISNWIYYFPQIFSVARVRGVWKIQHSVVFFLTWNFHLRSFVENCLANFPWAGNLGFYATSNHLHLPTMACNLSRCESDDNRHTHENPPPNDQVFFLYRVKKKVLKQKRWNENISISKRVH